MSENERIISDVNSSMKMEGLPLTAEDRQRLQAFLSDPSSLNQMVRELVKKHSVTLFE